jgi:hypothetical protein
MSKNSNVIRIVEISSPNHSNLIESWINVFKCNNSSDVSLFINEKTAARLNRIDNINIASKNNAKLLFQLISIMRSSDHVILNSIQTHFFIFSLSIFFKKCKLTLCVHNANAWQGITSGPLLKRLVKKFYRSFILKRINTFAFCSQSVLDSFKIFPKLNKIVIPFQLSPSKLESNHGISVKKVVVVYPGMISKKRKKYLDIINAFKELSNQYELHLLGKPIFAEGGAEILALCKGESNITTYHDFIPVSIFDEILNTCNFIITDLGDGRFEKYDYIEQYGRTKDSGVSHLIAKHHKPLILNHEISRSFTDDQPILSFKNTEDIKRILSNFISKSDHSIQLKKSLLSVSINTQPFKIYEKVKHVYF